jgi:hypothetical protein
MSITQWLRSRTETATKATAPARTPAQVPSARAVPAQVQREMLWLDATEVAAAWRPSERRLLVPTARPLEPGKPVVVRITSRATGLDLSLNGSVLACRGGPGARACRAEIDPGEEGAKLVCRLVAGSQGGAELVKAREPRLRVAMPAVVSLEAGQVYMTTVSASRGGCGLAWSGPPPRLHASLQMRLGSGARAVTLRGRVCWVRQAPRGARVGLRLVGGELEAWAKLLAESREGAEAA